MLRGRARCRLPRPCSLGLLLGATLLLVPAARAADEQDIVPERQTLRHMALVSYDPNTGLLQGTIAGEPAGTGSVSVQILDVTRPRRAPVAG